MNPQDRASYCSPAMLQMSSDFMPLGMSANATECALVAEGANIRHLSFVTENIFTHALACLMLCPATLEVSLDYKRNTIRLPALSSTFLDAAYLEQRHLTQSRMTQLYSFSILDAIRACQYLCAAS